jgi:6-phosphogluconolactonase (cycloisomerase 2 family)
MKQLDETCATAGRNNAGRFIAAFHAAARRFVNATGEHGVTRRHICKSCRRREFEDGPMRRLRVALALPTGRGIARESRGAMSTIHRGHHKMRIAPSLTLVCAALLSACGGGMDTTSPERQSVSPSDAPSFDRASQTVGRVFTMSNEVAGNSVLVFGRAANGSLHAVGTFATGGAGTGAGLGNQGGLALDESGSALLVVNAGSNEISAFRVRENGSLELTDRIASGGTTPISITISHGLAYVLNAGGAGNIAGFSFERGKLRAIANSSRPLSGAGVGPAQVSFDPSGQWLVVTEKGTNRLSTYAVDKRGVASGPTVTAANGITPFGFAFTNGGRLIVSEAFGGSPNGSAVSTYWNYRTATWSTVSGSVPTTETSACWIVVTENGRFTYTTNAASGTITGYSIREGILSRLNDDGVTANIGAGSAPSEMALSRNSQFLYALSGGQHAIVAYAVNSNGSLTPITSGAAGLPGAANGLAAR